MPKKNGIATKVLEIETTENETSDTITKLIIKQLRQNDLLSKGIAFAGDNCNTNFGGIERRYIGSTMFFISSNKV